MVKVAVMGYGTIGSGVVTVLRENAELIEKRAGQKIEVTRVLDLRDLSDTPVADIHTEDFNDILNDPEIDIVVEVMGGTGAAYKFSKESLLAGKSVVTSNKALVAAYGPELLQIAREKNVNFMFEASVGGGIPIIRPLISSLTPDEILEITGILNGTTNFILSKMYEEGSALEPVLKEAQDNGFAEADPTADIEGYDACRKIAILASLSYGRFVDFNDISCKGITQISDRDITYAKALGKKIKLLGTASKAQDGVYAEVAPFMIGPDEPLFSVDGVMNAVFVKGNMVGDLMFYGAGAGSLPTASAVVADIISETKNLNKNMPVDMEPEKLDVEGPSEHEDKFFIRVRRECETLGVPTTEIIELPEFPDEYAVITDVIKGSELDEKLSGKEEVISVIKLK